MKIFATNIGWLCLFPMKPKSEAHEAQFLLLKWNRVPNAIICDNAKDMVLDEINRKFKEALCHLRWTEHFTPWSNAAEREIRELKKGSGRRLIKSGMPTRLWDDFLELKVQHCSWHL